MYQPAYGSGVGVTVAVGSSVGVAVGAGVWVGAGVGLLVEVAAVVGKEKAVAVSGTTVGDGGAGVPQATSRARPRPALSQRVRAAARRARRPSVSPGARRLAWWPAI
jgi:hypothetical protein